VLRYQWKSLVECYWPWIQFLLTEIHDRVVKKLREYPTPLFSTPMLLFLDIRNRRSQRRLLSVFFGKLIEFLWSLESDIAPENAI